MAEKEDEFHIHKKISSLGKKIIETQITQDHSKVSCEENDIDEMSVEGSEWWKEKRRRGREKEISGEEEESGPGRR